MLGPGIHPESVQDHSRGSKIVSKRPAVQGSGSAYQLRTPSVLQSRRDGLVCPHRGRPAPFLSLLHSIPPISGIHPNFMCTGTLPEEPESMEEILQLGTRVKDKDKGCRRAIPTGCPSQERVHVERTARHCHGCPSGGQPGRVDRMGEGGPSVCPARKAPGISGY